MRANHATCSYGCLQSDRSKYLDFFFFIIIIYQNPEAFRNPKSFRVQHAYSHWIIDKLYPGGSWINFDFHTFTTLHRYFTLNSNFWRKLSANTVSDERHKTCRVCTLDPQWSLKCSANIPLFIKRKLKPSKGKVWITVFMGERNEFYRIQTVVQLVYKAISKFVPSSC